MDRWVFENFTLVCGGPRPSSGTKVSSHEAVAIVERLGRSYVPSDTTLAREIASVLSRYGCSVHFATPTGTRIACEHSTRSPRRTRSSVRSRFREARNEYATLAAMFR